MNFTPEQQAKLDSAEAALAEVERLPTELQAIKGDAELGGYFKNFAQQNPHLVKSDYKPGVGSTEASMEVENTASRHSYLKSLFGRGSDSKRANEIGLRDPREYKLLGAEARMLKIIN